MATTFQLCAPEDADRLTGLVAGWLSDGAGPSRPGLRRGIERLLDDSRRGHVWIIERADLPVGYAVLTFAGPTERGTPRAYVAGLYIEPGSRGQGIGTKALRFLSEIGAWLQVPVHSFGADQERKHASLFNRPDLTFELAPMDREAAA
jgi:GNAT superfamily N-acetyltransferase